MEYLIPIKIEKLPEDDIDGYLATCDEFPVFHAQGKTIEETVTNAKEVMEALIDVYIEKGKVLPFVVKNQKETNASILLDVPDACVAAAAA